MRCSLHSALASLDPACLPGSNEARPLPRALPPGRRRERGAELVRRCGAAPSPEITPLRSPSSGAHRPPLPLPAAACRCADDATDILEAANQVQLNDRRDNQQPKADADFFNRFDDDADEADMRPAA